MYRIAGSRLPDIRPFWISSSGCKLANRIFIKKSPFWKIAVFKQTVNLSKKDE